RLLDAHVPEVAGARLELRARIGDADRIRRVDFSAVPDLAVTRWQSVSGTGNEDLVSSLPPIALGVVALPREVWCSDIDSKGVLHILRTKPNRGGIRSRRQQRGNQQHANDTNWCHSVPPRA